MPDNYFTITYEKQKYLFHCVFFQKWSFFAPPPESDNRIYFVIRDKSSKNAIAAFEILKKLEDLKHKKAPFNQEETVIDYLISSSAINLTDAQREEILFSKYLYPDSSDSFHREVFSKSVSTGAICKEQMQTLKNYAKIVCNKNKINPTKVEFKVLLTNVDIPEFKDRNKTVKKRKELLLFESTYMQF